LPTDAFEVTFRSSWSAQKQLRQEDFVSSARAYWIACLVVVLSGVALADKSPVYQKGTLTKNGSTKTYHLTGPDKSYDISNCADFQDGQVVDYRAQEETVFISREGGKEYKCAIKATFFTAAESAATQPPPRQYLKGTIEGFETRRDYHIGGGGGGGNGTPANPVSSWTRKAKVYELRGADLIYKVDYCGAFQAGKFAPGQTVEYRVERDRLYILHDQDKEYSCQIEGTRLPENAQPSPDAKPDTPSTAAPAASPGSR
jgi:hypothetical protein